MTAGTQAEQGKIAVSSVSLRHVGALGAGNALEFYDFLVYAFFATQIGRTFFPGSSDNESLMLVLATFAVGFLTRPLGGLVIGVMGDRSGRKPALLLSFGLMGLATAGLALTPSYASIGAAGPALAILCRLLQGFALGGEVGPASAWLLEAAPERHRALYVSLQFSTQWAGGLAASLVGLMLAHLLGPVGLQAWGWRIALLLGVAVVPAGLWLRYHLPETLARQAGADELDEAPVQIPVALCGMLLLSGLTVATYVLSYVSLFGGYAFDFSSDVTFGGALVCGLFGTLVNPLGGLLSDRLGRRRVLLGAMAALLVAALPCFLAVASWKSPRVLYLGEALMTTLLALSTPAALTLLMENLPARVRSGGVGMIYALAIAIFGGTTQYMVTGLMEASDSTLVPAAYMMVALLVGLLGAALMQEPPPTASAG